MPSKDKEADDRQARLRIVEEIYFLADMLVSWDPNGPEGKAVREEARQKLSALLERLADPPEE